jgi:uncharacterized protein (DUF2237 family)
MKTCCQSTTKDKQCVRKSDGKTFKLPRRFSKKRCKQGVKGFTMRSSCAAYKDCLKGGAKRRLTYKKNILGKKIKKCSTKPMTGFYRDGYCMTGAEDLGTHTVCAKINQRFLDYTAKKGNDLSSVVKPGDKWCLCEYRWLEAHKDGKAPKVIKSATNARTDPKITRLIKKQKGGERSNRRKRSNRTSRQLPQLRKLDKSNKTHIYKLKDPHKKRILAIDEGIRCEMRKGNTRRSAALSKKKRFNVLRLYRKNNDPDGCRRLTQDMKYMDKKYDTGVTQNICKKKGGSNKDFLYNPDNPKKSFDVYIDKNPKDTIHIKYTTVQDVKDTIKKLEKLYKAGKYPHKRIWQVGMIMKVRLEVLKSKKKEHFRLANRYFKHLGERTKIKGEKERKKFIFKI